MDAENSIEIDDLQDAAASDGALCPMPEIARIIAGRPQEFGRFMIAF